MRPSSAKIAKITLPINKSIDCDSKRDHCHDIQGCAKKFLHVWISRLPPTNQLRAANAQPISPAHQPSAYHVLQTFISGPVHLPGKPLQISFARREDRSGRSNGGRPYVIRLQEGGDFTLCEAWADLTGFPQWKHRAIKPRSVPPLWSLRRPRRMEMPPGKYTFYGRRKMASGGLLYGIQIGWTEAQSMKLYYSKIAFHSGRFRPRVCA